MIPMRCFVPFGKLFRWYAVQLAFELDTAHHPLLLGKKQAVLKIFSTSISHGHRFRQISSVNVNVGIIEF
jgi:hypothetical protein